MAIQIQLRRDVESNWQSVNPILAEGELGLDLATNAFKIGDGIRRWNDLPYEAKGLIQLTSPVNGQSVFYNESIGLFVNRNIEISDINNLSNTLAGFYTQQQVDDLLSNKIDEAPDDGFAYVRQGKQWIKLNWSTD